MKKVLLFMLSMSMFGTSTASMFAQEVQKVAESLEMNVTVNTDSEEEILQEDEHSDSGIKPNVPTTFAGEPADWAFKASSRPLEQAILKKYPSIDQNGDGFISITETNQYSGNIEIAGQGITGELAGIENFINVREINLSRNDLTGRIPQDIGNLTHLTLLHLNGNHLMYDIPTSVGNLTKLISMNLSYNSLGAKLPESLTNLRSIKLLALNDNAFNSLSQSVFNFVISVRDAVGNRKGFLHNQSNGILYGINVVQDKMYENFTKLNASPAYSQFPEYDAQSQFVYELILPNGTTKTIKPIFAANGRTLTIPGSELTQSGPYQLNARITAPNAVFTGTHFKSTFWRRHVLQQVNFVTDTETTIESQDVLKGSYITDPLENIVLEKEGYDFEGWYRDEAKTIPWDFTTKPVMEDITLYANWKLALSLDAKDFAIALRDVSADSEEEILQEEQEQLDSETEVNVPATFAGKPADWAFQTMSRPLEQAILKAYPTIDRNNDGFISKTEANQYSGNISIIGQGITGYLDGIEHFVNIREINLSRNDLTGRIPQDIGNLTHLTLLHLNGNYLSNSIPVSIGNLTKLTSLNLAYNSFLGKIPNEFKKLRANDFKLLALDNNGFYNLSQETFNFIMSVRDEAGNRKGFLHNQRIQYTSMPQVRDRMYENFTTNGPLPAPLQFPKYDAQSQFVYELTFPDGTTKTIKPIFAANGTTLTIPLVQS